MPKSGVVEDLRGDGLPRFLRSRGAKLITPRALEIRASISVTNRFASDPHANSLLIRSSGSCRMFGHPRVSRSHCHANGKSQRPVPYTREGIFHVGCGTYAGVLCLPTWHAHSSCMPCVADPLRCHALGCASHLANARPMRTPRLTPRLTQVSRPTVHIPFTAPPSS